MKKYELHCKKCDSVYELYLTDRKFNLGKYKKFCSLSCANSRHHSENTKMKIGNSQPNKGRISYENRICQNCGINFQVRKYKRKKFCSVFCFHSFQAKSRKLGGYNRNSIKKHKKGMYKGYWCDSSWELAYVIYNLEHNIKFKRNNKKFPYFYKGKIKNFIPDFIVNDSYVEIKGYFGPEANAKIKHFTGIIEILDDNKIKKYINYCIDKYGSNFINKYEI